ncbi:hypothetical protein MJG53_018774 [Ovis ammon polii x Ovis aries]|uniref:Outer mitochondrial transmembrane helix translocase n=2 Tax=Ovis TaxID=9935 RepID=A0AAD4TQU4_OVIAM|nr:hypothetical protein MG293_019589 [Ovis ammon polii]KAI4550997.1 hypothetical protein MJT46_018504 [Ovis ammon polii x Ovis aries]KAI4551000.1 hypothetical protein MJT46_018507 [Ovis ammon polii x Ovis aries]KAI4558021.1 hypothetical protein MJG53_018774 [Ovis ammon polii x Ovis aries]
MPLALLPLGSGPQPGNGCCGGCWMVAATGPASPQQPGVWQRRQRNGEKNNPRNGCLLRRPPEPGPGGSYSGAERVYITSTNVLEYETGPQALLSAEGRNWKMSFAATLNIRSLYSSSWLTIKMVHAETFSRPLSRNEVVGLIFRLTIFGAVTYFTIKWMVDAIDPTRKQKVEAQKQAEKLMKQIGVKNVKLSEYEMSIAAHLVDPLNMHVTWSDIAGLDDVITDLKDTVILPIKKKHLFENSRLLQPPKGVLLYGPPGCGKTLIAKATAKEAGCRFINLQPSTLTDKWYGESQKLAAAVFSLAIKLQPSIIFIDEIDSFLRNRSSSDHEATAMMKAQFMSLWDGLDTDHSCQVIVMGATNRPQDLDSAIMRRMPTRFHINQPALKQREAILKLILKNENVDRHVDLLEVAQETDGFSGSDLKEMCRDAALLCVREYVNSTSEESHDEDEIRPVQQQDLHRAIEKMKKSKDAAFQSVLTHVCLD